MRVGELSYFRIFSMPRNAILVLAPGESWPARYDGMQEFAILAWSGRASCLQAALRAAF